LTHWDQRFPSLASSKDEAVVRFKRCASTETLQEGEPVFHVGSRCENYLLVVEGSVRVLMISDTGREVVLYHVRPGESCVLTTSCLLGGEPYPAEGVAETLRQRRGIRFDLQLRIALRKKAGRKPT